MQNYHITNNNGKWNLKKEGSNRPSRSAATKEEIIKQTQQFMDGKTASVKIHKLDGTFQEERTYQRKDDPRRSKG